MPHEMPMGACECGAVYACDVTGHNLGTAMIEALVFGCNGDWDLAWDLLPEEDYLTKEVSDYDYESHLIVHSSAYEGRSITGVLYFIRFHRDIRDVTEDGFRQRIKDTAVSKSVGSHKKAGKKLFTKGEIEKLVKDYDIDILLNLADQDKRIIRDLQRLLYSADDLLRLRAADTLGRVSGIIALQDPRIISRLLQNLLLSVTDTAASSWGALDAIGEIISNRPQQFISYTPQLYPLIRDSDLLPKVLRALAKIISTKPEAFLKLRFRFIPLLRDSNPEVRAYASILLGALGAREARENLRDLVADDAEVAIYEDGFIKQLTVGELATESIDKIGER